MSLSAQDRPEADEQNPTIVRETTPGGGGAAAPPVEAMSPAEERFEHFRKLAGVVLAPLAFALTYFLLGDSSLSYEARKLSAILAAVGILWVTELLPLPVTALLGAVLCVLLGVAPAKQVLAYFADPIVFVFIGGFILARAMTVHALDRRIALSFLSIPWVGAHPARMLGGLGLVTALLSMWVSNTATTAMMLPIALGILAALHQVRVSNGLATGPMDPRNWPFATGMMLMVAYAASIGGIGTPVGSPPNLIGIGLIRTATGRDIGFFQWMAMAIPMFLLMGAALFVLLYALHPAQRSTINAAFSKGGAGGGAGGATGDMGAYIRNEKQKLGRWTRGQVNALIAFLVAVTLWILPGVLALPMFKSAQAYQLADNLTLGRFLDSRLPEAIVAITAAVLLFLLPLNLRKGEFTLTWPDAAKIDWGTILLFGGGLALGTLMFEKGVAKAMGESLTGLMGPGSVWALTGMAVALGIVLSEATSNTASANMIIPVVIGIAQASGVSPIPPALGACLGASYGFMLPVSTPPNAIVYGSGLVPITKMMRAGVVFDVLGFFIIWGGLRVLCPALGLM